VTTKSKVHAHITAEYVRDLLNYDISTGVFTWKRSNKRARAGAEAGWRHSMGGRQIRVRDMKVLTNRLAWLHVTGEWPPDGMVIDHINRNRADDRFENLRLCTQAQNRCNSTRPRHNTSGVVGVLMSARPHSDTWRAQITINNKTVHLGTFRTKELAIEARKAAEQRQWGQYAPGDY